MSSAYAMECDRFIQEIMAHPEIWMLKHPDRKNKFKVKKHWDEVRKKYPEFTVDELKKRWKNLKDTYRKELKKLPQSRPGVPADNFKSGWRYYDSLFFLKDEFSFSYKELVEDASSSQIEPEKYTEVSSQSPASPASSRSEDEMPEAPSGSNRKDAAEIRAEFLKIEKRKMKILEEEISRTNEYLQSDNYHFLMSLLPEMDKLPPLQKMRLRTKISQAVLDEVSLAMYDDQQSYGEVQTQDQIHFVAAPEENNIIKEEAINMYD